MSVKNNLQTLFYLSLFLVAIAAITSVNALPNTQLESSGNGTRVKLKAGHWYQNFGVTRDVSYGEHSEQKLDVYRQGTWTGPPHYFVYDKKPTATFIYIHGGAWHGGKKEDSLWSVMPFVEHGWQAINIEYRTGSGTAPNAADDVLLALKWLSENAEAYAIDLDKLVISGDSAGGHLALLAGLTAKEGKPPYLGEQLNIAAIINWFGITDIKALDEYFVAKQGWNYPRLWAGNDDMLATLIEDYSPIMHVTKASPKILSIHGTADKVVPISQAKTLHAKLELLGVENQLLALEGGRHLGFTDEQFQKIFDEILKYVTPVY